MMEDKFVDFTGLREYDQQLKIYIDKKIAEAIEAYHTENEANNNNASDDQSSDKE